MTAQRFSQIDGVRYIRTGDLQKWDVNGNLVYCGRVDYQIKLRGQRIEPAEIEDVIMSASSDIRECLVMKVEGDEHDYLVAHVATTVLSSEEKLNATIEKTCFLRLAPIKRPTVYRVWHGGTLPRNRNGKINRAALLPHVFPTFK